MKKKSLIFVSLFFILVFLVWSSCNPLNSKDKNSSSILDDLNSSDIVKGSEVWDQVPVILGRIVPPVFQQLDFNITNYGAAGNGTTDCTEAFKSAITACNAGGGGRVIVPSGTFITGAIQLKSNVNLYISPGATIKFSQDYNKYLPVVLTRFEGVECYNYSPFIYAYQQTNVAVTGTGTLNGNA